MARPLYEIAREIRQDWKKVSYNAKPYLEVLAEADSVNDRYIVGDHRSTVRGFLGNASTWKGEKAKAIKAELKALLQ